MTKATLRSHGKPCAECGVRCYSDTGKCRDCQTKTRERPSRWPHPKFLPEDYLMQCAQELKARHEARAEALRAIGMLTEAA